MTSSNDERINRPTKGQTDRETHAQRERHRDTTHTQRDNDTMMTQQNNTQEKQTHKDTPRGVVM